MVKFDMSKPIDVPFGPRQYSGNLDVNKTVKEDEKNKHNLAKSLDDLQNAVKKNIESLTSSIQKTVESTDKSDLEIPKGETVQPIARSNGDYVLKQIQDYIETKLFFGKKVKCNLEVKDNILYIDNIEIIDVREIYEISGDGDYFVIKTNERTSGYNFAFFLNTQDDLDYAYIDSIRKDKDNEPGEFIFENTEIYKNESSKFDYDGLSKKEKKEMLAWADSHDSVLLELNMKKDLSIEEEKELDDLSDIYEFYNLEERNND